MDFRLLLYSLIIFMLIIYIVNTGTIFYKLRTKYSLIQLILLTIFLVLSVLNLLLPGRLNKIITELINKFSDSPSVHLAVQISIFVVIVVVLFILLFYPAIKRRIARWQGETRFENKPRRKRKKRPKPAAKHK